ncbi:MAG: aspartate aminotransferase family protein [Candidatus Acidoferrales bacterium]|nr:aspartate aminotransferase family protein [Candidatus Acidoferrales bacterium]
MAKKKPMAAKRLSAPKIRADEARYMMKTYRRPPEVFTHGRGCRLYDSHGRGYLDFLAGIAVNATGYVHPRMVRVIRREAGRATHVSNLFHNAYQAPLARKLAQWSGLDRVFFSNSGSEAVEGAMKLARAYAHAKSDSGARLKTRFLALENSFHGRTFGALSITHTAKYREPFAPLVPGAEFVRFNDVADLDAKFDDTVCAVVIEPIQGEGGVHVVSEEFWNRARQLTAQHGAALIADEIQSGLGRTGRRFAYQKFSSLPDIVTVAKPLAGGLPLGAFIASEEFASALSPGMHGSTFGGGPLVCAAALEFLTIVEEENLLANVRERGAELRAGLEKLAARFDFIREVRGEGLILGLDLSVEGAPFVAEALRMGLLINCTHDHILRLLPPFVISKRDVAEFLKKFETVLARAAKFVNKSSNKPAAAASKSESQTQPLVLAATR